MEKSCWWIEGGKCYYEPCEREENGTSTRLCAGKCVEYKNKREFLSKFLSKFFPSGELIIMSEEGKKNDS